MTAFLKAHKDGVILSVRVVPGASRNSMCLDRPDAITVHLTSPPVEGRANKELVRLLAKKLRLAPSKFTIMGGQKSRIKVVLVRGISVEFAQRMIVAPPPVP